MALHRLFLVYNLWNLWKGIIAMVEKCTFKTTIIISCFKLFFQHLFKWHMTYLSILLHSMIFQVSMTDGNPGISPNGHKSSHDTSSIHILHLFDASVNCRLVLLNHWSPATPCTRCLLQTFKWSNFFLLFIPFYFSYYLPLYPTTNVYPTLFLWKYCKKLTNKLLKNITLQFFWHTVSPNCMTLEYMTVMKHISLVPS